MLTERQKTFIGVLICFIVPLGGMSTDIYLPSLPAIAHHFAVAKSLSQLSITAFVLAMGLCQLFAGPISDALGRKKLLLGAIITQILAALAIALSPSIYLLIIMRFLQGIGAAFMMVPARAINNDIFSGDQLKKQFNYNTISFAMSPILAPYFGGYIQHYLGWQANFYFLAIYAAMLLLLVSFFYKETLPEKTTFQTKHLWQNYHHILKNKFFILISVFIGVIWGYSALFNVFGPFLIQTTLNKSPVIYGRIALLMGIAWFLGNMLNRFMFHFSKTRKVIGALTISFIAIVTLITKLHYTGLSLSLVTSTTCVAIFSSAIIFPIYVAEGLSLFPKIAASTNACLFSLMWIIYSVFTLIASLLKTQTAWPLAFTFLTTCILSWVLYYGFIIKLEKRGMNQCNP